MNKTNWLHAVGQTLSLEPTDKAIAWAIGAHMNARCEAQPSQARIADYASCSPATVKRRLPNLVEAGLLRIEPVHGHASRYFGTQVTEATLGLAHIDELPTQVKSRGRARKTEVTQMSYEIQIQREANGDAKDAMGAAARWYEATGREKPEEEAKAFLSSFYGLNRFEIRLLLTRANAALPENAALSPTLSL